jgi:hypothetical protein
MAMPARSVAWIRSVSSAAFGRHLTAQTAAIDDPPRQYVGCADTSALILEGGGGQAIRKPGTTTHE